MKQYLVERIDNGREMPTHWDVIRRDDKGEEVVIESCGTQEGAALMAASLNGEEMARNARIESAYQAGYDRAAGAGRVVDNVGSFGSAAAYGESSARTPGRLPGFAAG